MQSGIKSIEVGLCAVIWIARVPPCSSVKNGTIFAGNIVVFGREGVANVVSKIIWARTCEKIRFTVKKNGIGRWNQ